MITIALAAIAMSSTATPRVQVDAPAPAPTAAKPRSKPTQYCVQSAETGSRIPMRECHSRAEWLERGFDPLAK